MGARPFRSVLVVLAALGGLTACRSTPSAHRVALDVIETLDQPETVKQCMRTKVDEDFTEDDLENFAKSADENPLDEEAKAALKKFEDDLRACVTSG